jgi:hypothetical protein
MPALLPAEKRASAGPHAERQRAQANSRCPQFLRSGCRAETSGLLRKQA